MSGRTPGPGVCPANPSRIFLTGFMGAGKTTVGALLAERLGWFFFDSDFLVEARAAMTVAQIFERRGEAAFRELEAEAIREAGKPGDGERLVLALGGGALESDATREYLASLPGALIIFLDAPLETMLARCAGHVDGPVRPVLADRARLRERLERRLPWYGQAHLTVVTGELTPEGVVDAIMQTLDPKIAKGSRSDVHLSAGTNSKPGVQA